MDGLDRKLRYFLKIADFASLSGAAEDLGLSQPALSRNLASLEGYIGSPLFLRTGRGMDLTNAGRKLIQVAGPAYTQIDGVLAELREREGFVEGSLKIAAIHTISHDYATDLLARFVSKYQQVNLSILARSSPDVVYLVEKGTADIGFVYATAVTSEALESTPLFVDEMCLITSARNFTDTDTVDLAQAAVPLVGFPKPYALRRMLKSAGLDDRVVAEAETINAMLRLCSMDIGGCVLPSQTPSSLLTDYGLKKIPLQPPGLRRRVVAIVRRDAKPNSLAHQLLALIRS